MQFGAHGPHGLGRKEVYVTKAEYGEDSYCKEHYSQTAYPMRHHTPEEYGAWQRLNVLQDCGSRG